MPAQIIAKSTLHTGWMKVFRVRVRLESGEEVEREVEDHGRGVAVLPYDPHRRVALLVHLLRAPVLFAAGPTTVLEVPAGLVEEDDRAVTARRELYEETGLRVSRVDLMGEVWTAPGVSTERLDLYVAAYSREDRVGPGGGAEGENEHITVNEIPLAELWALVEGHQITDMKTLLLIMMLKSRLPEIFAVHRDST